MKGVAQINILSARNLNFAMKVGVDKSTRERNQSAYGPRSED